MSYTEKAAKYICYFFYGTLVFLFLKYGLAAVLPFGIAFVVATLAEKAANKLTKKTGISRKVYSAVIILMLLSVIIATVFAVMGRLFYEAKEFASDFLSEGDPIQNISVKLSDFSETLIGKLNIGSKESENVKKTVDNVINGLTDTVIGKLGDFIEKAATGLVGRIPSIFLFITVSVISTFYIACGSFSKDPIGALLTTEQKKKILRMKNGLALTVAKYVRAYSTLILITATVMFVGFSIIKVKYAFLIALLVAVLDLLPVIGIGTILIPWGLLSIVNGEQGKGFALFAIFSIAVVVREIAEPKIIGKCIGANPVITLFSMYTGLKLFGIGGLVLLPMLVSGTVAYYSEKNKSSDIKKRAAAKRADINSH